MLRLLNLRKAFGALVAVDGLSIEVRRGEVFGLLGPNGAGKSTTISMTMGLLSPDAGSIEIEGVGSPTRIEARRCLGYAPQSLALYEDLTALENLKFFGAVHEIEDVKKSAERALDAVGLSTRGKDLVGGFSGGMKRRLNLAVALLHAPALLLLDEPTAGVDPQSRHNIMETVRGLAAQGRTIVYTTHYMEEAAKICDRVGVIDKGRLLAIGTVPELIGAHGGKSVLTLTRAGEEVRTDTSDPLPDISRALQAGDVTAVRIDRPDLESVFLNLTGRSLRD